MKKSYRETQRLMVPNKLSLNASLNVNLHEVKSGIDEAHKEYIDLNRALQLLRIDWDQSKRVTTTTIK